MSQITSQMQQIAFAKALLDPDAAIPAGLAARDGDELRRRFGVYRNNVVASLIDALRERFPATEKIVGEEFFIAMVQVYLRQSPPQSPILYAFGDTFADFVDAFPPAAEIAYLGDVMRIEAAQAHCYHAADRAPLTAADLAAIAPDALGELRLRLLPGTFVLTSHHPAHTIWAMNAGLAPLGDIADWQGESTLIARRGFDVETRAISAGVAMFLRALQAGAVLAEAADQAATHEPQFNLTAALGLLLEAGLIAAIQHPSEDK